MVGAVIVAGAVRKRQAYLFAVVVSGLVPLAASDSGAVPRREPALTLTANMPDDFKQLAASTWRRFVRAFPARAACLDPVTVDSAWEFRDRAAYDAEHRVVTVRIPGTAPNLEASLVHEFAHHLDLTCGPHGRMRKSFLSAQGVSRGAPWWEGPTWEETPSEQWAEAVTEFVLGRRPGHTRSATTPAALAIIRAWAR
jgi:hypothetical protein